MTSPIRHSLWNRLFGASDETRTATVVANDEVTGLMRRDTLLAVGAELVGRAEREASAVAVVSVLIDGIDVPNSEYTEDERNHVLGAFAAELRDQMSPTDVVGRVGLAEFVWITVVESKSAALRTLAAVRADIDASLGADAGTSAATYSLGVTLSRGSDDDLATLLGRARQRRGERVAA